MDDSVFARAHAQAKAADLRDQRDLAPATRVRALQLANACVQGLITLGEYEAETRALEGRYFVAMRRLRATRRDARL